MGFELTENGLMKRLEDGRVLHARRQICNSMLTLSDSAEAPGWAEGW
jgi:hypothetical protein